MPDRGSARKPGAGRGSEQPFARALRAVRRGKRSGFCGTGISNDRYAWASSERSVNEELEELGSELGSVLALYHTVTRDTTYGCQMETEVLANLALADPPLRIVHHDRLVSLGVLS